MIPAPWINFLPVAIIINAITITNKINQKLKHAFVAMALELACN